MLNAKNAQIFRAIGLTSATLPKTSCAPFRSIARKRPENGRDGNHPKKFPRHGQLLLLAVARGTIPFSIGFCLAFIRACYCVSIPALTFKVIHARFRVHPYNLTARAMLLGLLLRLELQGVRKN